MSNSKLNIPKTIKVGFQKRQGTYTGKLAYVIYTDQKGILRKEKSWQGWRDHKIAPQDFDNVPTEGFVLNKKVGDYRGSWDGRQAWIRIYDPRDFEFEISVNNLVFILEECSAIKGKGLEGQFVYAWDGTELVLLPVSSQEYQDSTKFTELQTKSIDKSELKEGCTYIDKNMNVLVYLGRNNFFQKKSEYNPVHYVEYVAKKAHVFEYLNKDESPYSSRGKYVVLSPKDIKAVQSTDVINDYTDRFEKFKKSEFGCQFVPKLKPKKFRNAWEDRTYAIKIGDTLYQAYFTDYDKEYLCEVSTTIEIKDNRVMYKQGQSRYNDRKFLSIKDGKPTVSIEKSHYGASREVKLSKEEVESLSLLELKFERE